MLIAVTMRASAVTSRAEHRDSLDQNWVGFLQACNINFVLVPNSHSDPVTYLKNLGVQGVLLTGGGPISGNFKARFGKTAKFVNQYAHDAKERDRTEYLLLEASLELNWGVLGVCRGMQIINLFHGGSLRRIDDHVNVTHKIKMAATSELKFPRVVNSYHEYGITKSDLGSGLVAQCTSAECVEAFKHQKVRHYGIMWHPERVTEHTVEDVMLFKNIFMAS